MRPVPAGKSVRMSFSAQKEVNWNLILNVLLWILLIAAIILGLLYYFGRKLEKKQAASQSMMESAPKNKT